MRVFLLTFLITLFVAAPTLAQCPDAMGQWSTQTGTMIGGRASEAYCTPLAQYGGVPGNTQNAQSWNGTALGTQWRAWGMAIDAIGAVLIGDTVDPGTGDGTRTYQTFYEGGQFWLSRDETWADGLADLTGDLLSFQVITTLTIMGGNVVGASSNISFGGSFANCDVSNGCDIEFAIANALLAWNQDFPIPMPTGYPPFECGATLGEMFDVCCITISIDCTVPTVEGTWSDIKAQYR